MSNLNEIPADLPTYQIRVSHRAKRMQLKVSPLGEVEVVLPRRTNPKHVPPFVAQHQAWIEQTQKKMAALYPPAELLPGTLKLAATEQIWQLNYLPGERTRVVETDVMPAGYGTSCLTRQVLKIYSQNDDAARAALRRWLKQRATEVLIPWLHRISDDIGITFARAVIRAQKTRWGSCSSSGTISLNCALLFMPPETVRYLFIHELCHTKEMNHSPRYWALVERLMPDYKKHEQVLGRGMRSIPRWALTV